MKLSFPGPQFVLAAILTMVLTACSDSPARSIDFRQKDYPSYVTRVTGISGAEPWGRWTDGGTAVIEFAEPLPDSFRLELKIAQAYAENVNAPITAKVGSAMREFKVAGTNQDIVVSFAGVSGAKAIEFAIPKPTSPKELGESDDARKLGIGLIKLSVK